MAEDKCNTMEEEVARMMALHLYLCYALYTKD